MNGAARTFRDFMEDSLYGPGGYYQTRTVKADFYTAPELHPAFGRALALEIHRKLEGLSLSGRGLPTLVEAGCGDGTLLRSVLAELRRLDPRRAACLRVCLVERSDAARAQAEAAARASGFRALAFKDVSELPQFDGVLYSNELLDAIPFHLFEKCGGEVKEVLAPGGERLGALSGELASAAARVGESLQEGERHVHCPARLEWLKAAAAKLRSGALISIDYGRRYPENAPVPVKTFSQHRLGSDPFADPGKTDITAAVDFEPLMAEGEKLGLKTELFAPMGRFLMDRGVLEAMAAAPEGTAGWQERNKLKTLIHPEGMGEIFKVLIQTKSFDSAFGVAQDMGAR